MRRKPPSCGTLELCVNGSPWREKFSSPAAGLNSTVCPQTHPSCCCSALLGFSSQEAQGPLQAVSQAPVSEIRDQRVGGGENQGICLSSFSDSAFLSFMAPTSVGQALHDSSFDWSPYTSVALRMVAVYSYRQFWVASLSSVELLAFVGIFLH